MAGRKASDSLRFARHQRLLSLYSTVVELLMHEGRFVSERTNNFLSFNSVLFTGYLILSTQFTLANIWIIILSIALPIAGLMFSVFQAVTITRTIDALDYWRSSLGLIESHPDYWYPGKVKADTDLDVITARNRHYAGIRVRQFDKPIRLEQAPVIVKRLSQRIPAGNRVFVIWLPGIVGLLWLFALANALTIITSEVIKTPVITQIPTATVTRTITPTYTPVPEYTITPVITTTPTLAPVATMESENGYEFFEILLVAFSRQHCK